jgi:hypothetical protein
MKQLSNYTNARYCSDIADVRAGMDEIWEAIQRRNSQNKDIPFYFHVRLTKLKNKLNKLTNKTKKL